MKNFFIFFYFFIFKNLKNFFLRENWTKKFNERNFWQNARLHRRKKRKFVLVKKFVFFNFLILIFFTNGEVFFFFFHFYFFFYFVTFVKAFCDEEICVRRCLAHQESFLANLGFWGINLLLFTKCFRVTQKCYSYSENTSHIFFLWCQKMSKNPTKKMKKFSKEKIHFEKKSKIFQREIWRKTKNTKKTKREKNKPYCVFE